MKRFIPLLISLVTLASCTGMLDDVQSQIDDLDSRVTALEKDSKLISENLSTVKKDLEAGLTTISAFRKDTDEIVDTLYACKLRMQNDLDVSMKLVQTAMYDIDHLDRNSSELAQSVVDAYAAIDVALKLGNQNSDKIAILESQCSSLVSFSSKLSTFETLLNALCSNCVYSRSVVSSPAGNVIYTESNKSGYVLKQTTKISGSITERIYTPGKYSYQEYCEYSGGYEVTDMYVGYASWVQTWVYYINWDSNHFGSNGRPVSYTENAIRVMNRVLVGGVDIQKYCYYKSGTSEEYDLTKLNTNYFPSSALSPASYMELICIFPNGIGINGYHISFYKQKRSNTCTLEVTTTNSTHCYSCECSSSYYSKLMKFVSDLYDSKKDGKSSYSWDSFKVDWNNFVDSSNFLDNSFKL